MIDILESRVLLAAGNILISTSAKTTNAHIIQEYTQAGALVREIAVPEPPSGYNQIKDLVVDSAGRIQLFHGGNYLQTYAGGQWSDHTTLNWKLFGVTYQGALATYKNYVYVQSQDTGSANGIHRFDANNNYAAQFFQIPSAASPDEPQDITLGMDGLLYVVGYHSFPGNWIHAVDPETMQVVKTVKLEQDTNGGGVTADAQGNLYTFGSGYLRKLAPDGTFIKEIVMGGRDIDISTDGKLLINNDDNAVILDTDLNVLSFFKIKSAYWGSPFVAWGSYQAKAGPAAISGTIYNDVNGNALKAKKEKGLAGVKVYVDLDNDGAFDNGEPSATTNAAGAFRIASVAPGAHKIRQVPPGGYRQSTGKNPWFNVTLEGLDKSGYVFGNTKKARVGGTLANDTSGDGQIQTGEPALAGWTVFADKNNNGALDTGELSTTTNAKGQFSLLLDAGNIVVRAIRKKGFTQTGPIGGVHSLNLANGQVLTGKAFTFRKR